MCRKTFVFWQYHKETRRYAERIGVIQAPGRCRLNIFNPYHSPQNAIIESVSIGIVGNFGAKW